MKNNKTALVAGATGLVGKELLAKLLEDDAYTSVTTVSRKPINTTHEKLGQIVTDFDELEEVKDQLAADDVYCCLGTTMKQAGSKEKFYKVDYAYPLLLAQLAKAAGAKKYLLISAMGADKDSSMYYNEVKGKIEEAIEQISFESVLIFRPSLLLGDRKEVRTGEAIAKKLMTGLEFLMIGPLKKYRAIEASTVAAVMIGTANGDLQGIHIFESEKMKETVQ